MASIKNIIDTIETSDNVMRDTKETKEQAEYYLESAITISYPAYRKLKDIRSRVLCVDKIDYQDVNHPVAQRMQQVILHKIDSEIAKYKSEIIAAESLGDPKINLNEK